VQALLTELEIHRSAEGVATAYVGGGSPTVLPQDLLVDLATSLSRTWPDLKEFTVECNPGQVNVELLAELRAAGANRLSFGGQSFRAAELELLGRAHTVEEIGRAVELARKAGFENLSLDLIFAIPGSTLADWQYSVDAALELGVSHVSAYSLSFEPGTVFETWRRVGRLNPVDEELDRAMYEWVMERLGQAGLRQYEISNFARPGFECRHNLGYWANRPYVGIGPGASSSTGMGSQTRGGAAWERRAPDRHEKEGQSGDWRSQANRDRAPKRDTSRLGTQIGDPGNPCHGRRITHDPDIERYVAAVESGAQIPGEAQAVSWEDAICETAVLALRTRAGIDLAAFRERTGCEAIRTFAGPIRRYRDLGLIEVTDRAVRLTEQALPIADSILCDFAALE
jgi:putative oxygen-independent coproporphyrinogen III oxidase